MDIGQTTTMRVVSKNQVEITSCGGRSKGRIHYEVFTDATWNTGVEWVHVEHGTFLSLLSEIEELRSGKRTAVTPQQTQDY